VGDEDGEDDMLTTAEAAKIVGVSRRTMLRYVDRGWITASTTLPSGYHRFRRGDLVAQLDELRERLRERGDGDDPASLR
jgi:excisionase family DNA binding protein